MVIKLRSIINKLISISVCILLSFSIYKKCSQESHMTGEISVQTDSLLAEHSAQAVKDFIQANTISFENPSFFQLLSSHFPFIASYELEKNPSGIYACSIETAQPVLSINDTFALLENGRIAHITDFSSIITQSLRNIIMPEHEREITSSFRACMQQLAPELFQEYTVVWLNDQEALLYDRTQPHFAIRFNAAAIPNTHIMRQCLAIKNDLEQRGAFSCTGKKKPQQWITDIRFKDQIVVSWHVGGERYG